MREIGNKCRCAESGESDTASSAHCRMGAQVKMTDDMRGGIETAGDSDGARDKEIIINGNEGRNAQDEQLVRVANHYKHFGSG